MSYYGEKITEPTFGEFFRTLQIVFFALLVGQIMFMGMAYAMVGTKPVELDFTDPFIYVVPIVGILSIVVAPILFKSMVNKIDISLGFNTQSAEYRKACIIKFAILEAPVLFSVMAYFVRQNMFFIIVAAVLLLNFLLQRPKMTAVMEYVNPEGS